MELNDLIAMKEVNKGLSPYEQVKLDYMSSKHRTSGTAIAGLVLGTVGAAVGIGAWIFAPMYGASRSNEAKEAATSAKEVAMAYISGIDKRLDNIGALLENEVSRRIAGDQTITQTITDTVSGSQQGTLTAMQQAELAASQVATQQVMTGLMTGRYSENPQRVALYQDAKPCPCPVGGCGCNG